MKTLVYLKPHSVVWVGFRRRKMVEIQEQPINAGIDCFQPCSWLSGKSHTVPLILDCNVEEIQSYPLKRSGNVFRQRSNAQALQRMLMSQHSQSVIHTPAAKTNIDAVLLNQYQLSDLQLNWLKSADQHHCLFGPVATASALVADYIHGFSEQALVVFYVDGVLKHLYCASGYGLLVRVFEQLKPEHFKLELSETLNHLQSLEYLVEPLAVYVAGLSDQQIEQVQQLELVAQVHQLKSNLSASESVPDNHLELTPSNSATMTLAKHFIANRYLINHRQRHYCHPDGLTCFVASGHKSSALLLMCLSLGVGAQLIHVVQVERAKSVVVQEQLLQTTSITEDITNYRNELHAISPIAVPLGNALVHTAEVQSAKALNPAILITIIAGVLAEHSQLSLKQIAWSVVDEAGLNSLAQSDMPDSAQGPLNNPLQQHAQADINISSRQLHQNNLLAPSNIRVSLSGSVDVNQSLREQQTLVNSLAAAFRTVTETSNVVIAETPLAHAKKLNSLKDTNQPLAFRLFFDVVLSVQDDA